MAAFTGCEVTFLGTQNAQRALYDLEQEWRHQSSGIKGFMNVSNRADRHTVVSYDPSVGMGWFEATKMRERLCTSPMTC